MGGMNARGPVSKDEGAICRKSLGQHGELYGCPWRLSTVNT